MRELKLSLKTLQHAVVLTLACSVSLLSGCAANIADSAANATYSSSVLPSTTPAGSAATECNGFKSADGLIAGQITTYYENGTLISDKARLRLTIVPSQFDGNSNVHLQLYRWKANTASPSASLDVTPVQFQVSTAGQLISNLMSSISGGDVTQLRSAYSVGGTTSSQFFSSVTLIVSGLDISWDALKVVVYNGATPISQIDALIPIFAANPNTYATDHPGVLNQLHPFWGERLDNVAESQWLSRAQTFCF